VYRRKQSWTRPETIYALRTRWVLLTCFEFFTHFGISFGALYPYDIGMILHSLLIDNDIETV